MNICDFIFQLYLSKLEKNEQETYTSLVSNLSKQGWEKGVGIEQLCSYLKHIDLSLLGKGAQKLLSIFFVAVIFFIKLWFYEPGEYWFIILVHNSLEVNTPSISINTICEGDPCNHSYYKNHTVLRLLSKNY